MANPIILKDAVTKYLRHLSRAGRDWRTVRTYGYHFKIIMGFFGQDRALANITPQSMGRFLRSGQLLTSYRGKKRAERTVKQVVRVLRMLLEWARTKGLIDATLSTQVLP